MGILEVLFVAFVIMKLADVIDWSWWQVFIPIYVSVAIYAVWVTVVLGAALKKTR